MQLEDQGEQQLNDEAGTGEELDEGQEQEQNLDEGQDDGAEQGEQPAGAEGTPDAEFDAVTIGDEPPEEDEEGGTRLVRDLRKLVRERTREAREAKAELERRERAATEKQEPVGEKPTLESCGYDEAHFEERLSAWHERKRAAEAKEQAAREAQEASQRAWQSSLETYQAKKKDLRVSDYEDAEAAATEILNTTQQGIIVSGAENPALVVYALGKNPKKARELAAITDPVKYAFAIAKLEAQLKVTPRKSAPPPESTVRGSAPVSGAVGASGELERLRAEARKTGDYTKVTAYNRAQAEKSKAK